MRRYTATLHHKERRDVHMKFWARNLQAAIKKAWRRGSFDTWEAITVTDGKTREHVRA
jgi:hypothetical protein